MYKRTVKFEDFDGNERVEDFYFHMSKAEVIQWLTCNGGYTLDKELTALYKAGRGRDIMDLFEDLLRRSYGVKSVDGRRFDKDDEIWKNFRNTEAYSTIFTELVTDAKKAGAFVNAILPKKILEEATKSIIESAEDLPEDLKEYVTSDVLDADGNLVPMSPEKNPTSVNAQKPPVSAIGMFPGA